MLKLISRYILFLIVCLCGCSEKKYGAFVVAGRVENAPQQKIALQELPFNGDAPVIADTTSLKKNGSFELRAMAQEEGLYWLVLESGQGILLVNDGNHIRVRYDLNNRRKYTIEGSEASSQLQQLMEDLYQKDSVLAALSRRTDSAVVYRDSIVAATRLQIEKALGDRRSTLENFIKKSNSPAAIFFALGKFDPYYKPEDLKKQVDASAAKFPEHSGLAIYKAKMTRDARPEYALSNQTAPEIRMTTPAGDTLALSSFRGKYVLVDFWASWCKPCRRENPNVVAAFGRFREKNFTILGVSLDADKAAWVEAIGQDGLAWAHVSDLKEWRSAVVPQYQIEGIPFNVLVDPAGKIIASNLRGADLHNTLESLLK